MFSLAFPVVGRLLPIGSLARAKILRKQIRAATAEALTGAN
jgi:hypothetical protein